MKRTVLVVDDEANMQKVMRMVLEDAGYTVITAGSAEAALPHLRKDDVDVLVTDVRMPGMGGEALITRSRSEHPEVPVIVVTAHGTIKSAVRAVSSGASDYLTKPFEPEELEIAVHNAVKLRDILRENQQLKATVKQSQVGKQLLGNSPATQHLLEEIQRVAPYKTNVLIMGESGTGKELVARTIHQSGPRRDRPWVAINCSAIPRDLMESELFGYVKGAFTGANQTRLGRLEQAQGGTLFLDEIGDLDPALQTKLLRVLQEREFSALGSDQVRKVDVRIMAATNRNLKEMVQQGKFREDLYYRLDVYTIQVPPLRDRRDDIPLLAQAFLDELASETDKPVHQFSPETLTVLGDYSWPGNIRELHNAIERSLLSCRGDTIEARDLPYAILRGVGSAPQQDSCLDMMGSADLDAWLESVERRAILQALEQSGGVQAAAARKLGISERSLWHRIKKLKIQVNRSFA
jgi:two-component system response regulator AtoC